MRRSIILGVVLAALSFTGCKKDKKGGDTAASGSAMTGSDTAGSGSSMAGSGSAAAGSGSSMAGSDTAGSGSAAAGSGSAAAGSGSATTGDAGGGDPTCAKYAERFANCAGIDPKMKESMAKIFTNLKGSAKAKETCEAGAKGWEGTLTKAGC